jgi:peptidyl-dipeptidase A
MKLALALSLVALAGLCPATTPTVQSASEFVRIAEAKLEAAEAFANRAGWVRATDITLDSDEVLEVAEGQRRQLAALLAAEAAVFDHTKVDPVVRRKLDILKLLIDVPAPNRPGAAEELAAVSGRLDTALATGTFKYKDRIYTLKDAERDLAATRDPAEARALWEGWRSIGPPMRADYAAMVALGNEGARGLGFHDVGALWRAGYDMSPDAFRADVARLWEQLSPLYTNLHCYVRHRLNVRYGDAIQPRSGAIRADLLGNMWGQDWDQIYDLVAPSSSGAHYSLDKALLDHSYTPLKMVKAAEDFYVSLGLAPLPETFWQRSQITRPAGKKVDCNSSAWAVDARADVRIKVCFSVNGDDWYVAHHELGHNYYQRAYAAQPFLFRDGDNYGFHEAIGDFIGLSTTTPQYLQAVGLREPSEQVADPIPGLLHNALAKVPLLAFALAVDGWRWQVFDGEIPPEQYNSGWWRVVGQFQGLKAPSARPADAFDAFAKYHVASNTPYMSYFMARIYQYQFQRAACRIAGNTGPISQCSIYGSNAVGRKLNAMLELGRSRPTPETLEIFTGERRADASAMSEYFAPLNAWLEVENRGEVCGWQAR